MKPLMTNFDSGDNYPKNLFTAKDWYAFGDALGRGKTANIEKLAREYAMNKGGAFYFRASGDLEVYTKLESGKVRKTTYKSGTFTMYRNGEYFFS